MLEKQRHQLLLEILDEQQFASVAELTQQLSSSEATIRRDLIKLEKENKLRKIRGGAESLRTSVATDKTHIAGSAFLVNQTKKTDNKWLIAEAAAKLCENDESIIINGGTSTFMMGEFLCKTDVKILTNSYYLAQYIYENGQNQITIPSGEIYRKQGIILSSFDNDSIQNYRSDLMFTGTAGIGDFGVMETDPLLVRAEQKLRKQASRLIVLADGSKIGHASNFVLYPITDVDTLITDTSANPDAIAKIKAKGVKVIQVEIEK